MRTLKADDFAKVTDAREHVGPHSEPMPEGNGRMHSMLTTNSVEMDGEWHDVDREAFELVCAYLEGQDYIALSAANEALRLECEQLATAKRGDGQRAIVNARRSLTSGTYAGTRMHLGWTVSVFAPVEIRGSLLVAEGHGFTAREALEQLRQRLRAPPETPRRAHS